MSPCGVISRENRESLRGPLPLGLPHPPQHQPDREREERDAVPIGRGSAAPALVTPCRPLAPEVVPGRRLVPAQRPQPVGEAHEDQPARPGDPQHLPQHARGIRHMFEHVGGEAHVDRAVAHRQRLRVPAHVADGPQVHRHVPRSRRPESRREEPRPASDIQHTQPRHRRVPAHERHGVGRQRLVEGRRVDLLAPAGPHQPHSAPYPEEPPPDPIASHGSTVATGPPTPVTTRRGTSLRHPRPHSGAVASWCRGARESAS